MQGTLFNKKMYLTVNFQGLGFCSDVTAVFGDSCSSGSQGCGVEAAIHEGQTLAQRCACRDPLPPKDFAQRRVTDSKELESLFARQETTQMIILSPRSACAGLPGRSSVSHQQVFAAVRFHRRHDHFGEK